MAVLRLLWEQLTKDNEEDHKPEANEAGDVANENEEEEDNDDVLDVGEQTKSLSEDDDFIDSD